MEHAFRGDSDNTSPESTTFKMNSTEFEELGIKVGDKVSVEIEICNNDIGVWKRATVKRPWKLTMLSNPQIWILGMLKRFLLKGSLVTLAGGGFQL